MAITPISQKSMAVLAARVFAWPRVLKRALQVCADAVLLAAAYMSMLLLHTQLPLAHSMAVTVVLTTAMVMLLRSMRLYRAFVRYIAARSMLLVLALAGALALGLEWVLMGMGQQASLRFVTDVWLLSFAAVSLPRAAVRLVYVWSRLAKRQRVFIYGAGAAGRALAKALQSGEQYTVLGFLDDQPELNNSNIEGLRVWPGSELAALLERMQPSIVLLAMPSATRSHRSEIIRRLEPFPVAVKTVPPMQALIDGSADLFQVQDISIEDLLGRDPVAPITELIEHDVRNRVVMVTGAGGSIGSELCRQVLLQKPRALVLVERSEYGLYEVEVELLQLALELGWQGRLLPVLGDVADRELLDEVIARESVETLYHAAAYKHVPLVEANALAGVVNNVQGTFVAAQAAIANGVESFVLVSTDKAVRPTNVMGASKRWAELGIQALARTNPRTRFSIVRFGNVLGSSGSVIPRFRQQIAHGGPVTVTHPHMLRYFMTIPEAAQLVIQAGAQGARGEVFVLDMGEPVKIVDLAQRMIRLSGLSLKSPDNPHGDVGIVYTGMRPGEKLYEELLVDGSEEGTRHPRICRAVEPSINLQEFLQSLEQLQVIRRSRDVSALRSLLQGLPLAFHPEPASQVALALEDRAGEGTAGHARM